MQKTIRFDRETRDWSAELDGEYVGSFGSYTEAEAELDRIAFERLRKAQ